MASSTAAREHRTPYRRGPGAGRDARFLPRQIYPDDRFASRILLLTQFLRFLYFFVRLFFLWGFGGFFFGGFLYFLTFAHDFLRFEVAVLPCVIEH
jgi:hypothetical protein